MLHSPLSSQFQTPCHSNLPNLELGGTSHSDLTILSGASYLAKPLFSLSHNSSNYVPTQVSFAVQTPSNLQVLHQSHKIGSTANSSLSDSSSLSSSLISLQSISGGLQTSQQGSTLSPLLSRNQSGVTNNRDSRWLKLRLCPSFTNSTACLPTDCDTCNDNENLVKTDNSDIHSKDELSTDHGSELQCPLMGNVCPYAHPSTTVRVDRSYVTVCYDFIKRKNCKYSNCKYYHPFPHQIEAILKRGDEQKKMLETQQRLSELKTSGYIAMQPLQQTIPGGLPPLASVTGPCGSALRWPPTTLLQPNMSGSLYGNYLTGASQTLNSGLGPAPVLSGPFTSTSDPNSLNTSALLAAAVLQQHHNQNLNGGSGLLTASPALPVNTCQDSKSAVNNELSSSIQTESDFLSLNGSSIVSQLLNQLSGSQVVQHPQPPIISTQHQDVTTNLQPAWSLATCPPASVNSTDQPVASRTNSSVTSTASSDTTINCMPSFIRAGMKREANISVGNCTSGLDMHVWIPSKRSNLPGGSCAGGVNQINDSNELCNGNSIQSENDQQSCESNSSTVIDSTSYTHTFTCAPINPGFTQVGALSSNSIPSQVSSERSGVLNPLSLNIYGLPLTSQTATSPYSSQFIYPSLYSAHASSDTSLSMSSAAAAMALNNFLVHQQAQSQQLMQTQLPIPSTPQLSGSGIYPPFGSPTSALVTAAMLAAAQQSQHQPSDFNTVTSSNPALQQQQALILSLLLRNHQSQQAQLAVAQVAAAAAGYMHQGNHPRIPNVPTLTNSSCVIESPCSIPNTLTGFSSGPYGSAFCSQNPMTNVVYINDKGHLLESLPICRDFKAGKCRRNSECRYVHLVDENVEVNQGRVIVCRDAAKGRCTRMPCKYYHIPLFAISANRSMALNSALANAVGSTSATAI